MPSSSVNLAGINLLGASATALPQGSDASSILAWMQQTYGAVRYSSQQMTRYPYYYYTAYPAAGASELGFFAQNLVQVGQQLTNIENAGTLGNYSYLLTSIGFDIFLYIPTVASNGPWSYTTDALAPYADVVHGLTQGGTAEFRVANTLWDQIPLPLMFSPGAAIGKPRVELAQGGFSWAQAGGAPYAVTGSQASLCFADVERRPWRRRNFVNPIFIAPQQTFTQKILYPSGAIPVISTSVINNTTAFIYVGCRFDGWRFAPVS